MDQAIRGLLGCATYSPVHDVGDKTPLPPRSKLIHHRTAATQRTRHAQAGIRRGQAVPLRPCLDPVRNARQTPALTRSTHVRDRAVVHAVELEHGDVGPARVARLNGHRHRLACVAVVGDVEGARYGRIRCYAL